MQWIKATDRLPKYPGRDNRVIVRGDGFVAYGWKNYHNSKPEMYYIVGTSSYLNNNIEWLDESEPSFTLQNVIDAFENGLYGEAVEVYIKNTYDININALKK